MPGDKCRLVLFVVDSEQSLDDATRIALLHKKLQMYSIYVRSGTAARAVPGIRPHEVLIRVLCVRPPTSDMVHVNSVVNQDGTDAIRVVFADYWQWSRDNLGKA